MSARTPKQKQGGKDPAGKDFPAWGCAGNYFELPYAVIQSAAFRTLRPRAVAALVFLLSGWRPGGTYALPARQFSWRFHHATRKLALAELVQAGVVDCIDAGGYDGRTPAIFKLSTRWRARSAALMADQAAGKAQGKLGLWTPTRKAGPARLFKKGKASKARPTKRAVVEKAQAVVRGKKSARRNSSIEGQIN